MNISPEKATDTTPVKSMATGAADGIVHSSPSGLGGLLSAFAPITLDEMDSIRLMNRIDSKYLTDTLELRALLKDAAAHGYRVFEQDGERLHGYDSIYFDTSELRMFTEHRRGKAVRQKVRTRMYRQSGLCFLEVKRKNNRGRTKKKRIPVPAALFEDFRGDEEVCSWLTDHSDYDARSISPSLETSFCRITLVNKELSERLTIDLSVSFRNFRTGAIADIGEAVIIELKQDGWLCSEMQDILLRHRVKPMRVSKYCIGIVSTDSGVHPGRFRQKFRTIEKINKNFYLRCYRPVILQPLWTRANLFRHS